jgi:hypothetical protein
MKNRKKITVDRSSRRFVTLQTSLRSKNDEPTAVSVKIKGYEHPAGSSSDRKKVSRSTPCIAAF